VVFLETLFGFFQNSNQRGNLGPRIPKPVQALRWYKLKKRLPQSVRDVLLLCSGLLPASSHPQGTDVSGEMMQLCRNDALNTVFQMRRTGHFFLYRFIYSSFTDGRRNVKFLFVFVMFLFISD